MHKPTILYLKDLNGKRKYRIRSHSKW